MDRWTDRPTDGWMDKESRARDKKLRSYVGNPLYFALSVAFWETSFKSGSC